MPVAPISNTAPQVAKETPAGNPAAVSPSATAKQQMNVRIMEASASVSLSSGNDSQALLLRSAIDRINELLTPEFGENALQNAVAQDSSAEATAGRILELSTGFYEAYAARRKGDDPAQVAQDFVAMIRGGFEKGFGEARDILQGLNVLGQVESDINQTFALVQKGYDDFLAAKLAEVQPEGQSTPGAEAKATPLS
jgi:hypothetical protein